MYKATVYCYAVKIYPTNAKRRAGLVFRCKAVKRKKVPLGCS